MKKILALVFVLLLLLGSIGNFEATLLQDEQIHKGVPFFEYKKEETTSDSEVIPNEVKLEFRLLLLLIKMDFNPKGLFNLIVAAIVLAFKSLYRTFILNRVK